MHFNVDNDFSGAGRALTFGDFKRAPETDLRIVSDQLDIEGVGAAAAGPIDRHWADDQRTDDVDFWEQLELDPEAVGKDGCGGDKICRAVACRPKVCWDVFDEAADLLAPAAIEREKNANEKDREGDTDDRDAEARPHRGEVLSRDE